MLTDFIFTFFRELTTLLGEPGHTRLNFGKAIVAGWGKTYTNDDYKTGIVTSGAQQKLVVPIQSNADCIASYEDLFQGVDLSGDIR